jgi:hypothetical protein
MSITDHSSVFTDNFARRFQNIFDKHANKVQKAGPKNPHTQNPKIRQNGQVFRGCRGKFRADLRRMGIPIDELDELQRFCNDELDFPRSN